ncbi:MAG TPA: hypothetical protein P5016_04050 [Verrucomicrobiales bacterium]|nr:hypothetical protein [Verrucomicrobiales bacterium]
MKLKHSVGVCLFGGCLLLLSVAATAETPPPAKSNDKPAEKPAVPTPSAAPGQAKTAPAKSPVTVPPETKSDAKVAPKEADAKPGVLKVKAGPMEVRISLDAVLVAEEKTEISVAPKEWADLTVLEALPHGSVVKKGDLLVTLDLVKLDETIDALKRARPSAELDLQMAGQEFTALSKSTPMSLAAARRSKMQAEQDLAWYEDKGKPSDEKDVAEVVKNYEDYLSYAQEELNQLEKMYKADDLTEETEEIVLKRARADVERAKWRLEVGRMNAERQLNTSIPREHTAYRDAAEREEINWRKSEAVLPDTLKKKERELAELSKQFELAGKKIADLEADRKHLEVRAPHDGVLYYGAAARGSWAGAALVEKKLVPGGKLLAREVFMTVVNPSKLGLQANIGETERNRLRRDVILTGEIKAIPEAMLTAKLKQIGPVPYGNNTFDAFFSIEKTDAEGLYPGMTCKLAYEAFRSEKALTVPREALRRADNGTRYVLLGNGEKREVKTGIFGDKAVEIVSGLKEGDEILQP